jgi:pimeloyl-ACP methyl ester carboxylesterase
MRSEQKLRMLAGAGGVAALAAAGAAGQRRHMQRIAADPEQAVLREPPRGRPLEIESTDGTILHAEVFGPDSGPTIVLAHGWTESLTFWTYVIRELSPQGFRLVAYDLRGHGASGTATGDDYGMDRFGEDLEAVLRAAVPEGQRAVVAGHSLGAMSIVAWAESHDIQARASAAALLHTGIGNLIAEQLIVPVPAIASAIGNSIAVHGFLGARAPLPRFSTPLSHYLIRYVAFGPAATPAQVAFYERMLIASPPDARASIGIVMSEIDLAHALARLTVPTLVIAGTEDRLTPPSHACRIAQALPDLAGLVELADTGHMGPLERPGEISQALAGLSSPVAHHSRAVTA